MPVSSSSEPPAGHHIAVLIGINDYKNGIPQLRNAVRDVRAVAQVLREEHGYQALLLLNEQATLSGLRGLLAQLPTEISADTRLILYFAGHGIAETPDEDAAGLQGFLIPQDAQHDDPTTFLPMAEVAAQLSKLPCRHLLLLLDCCFAGAFRYSQTRSLRTRPATLYRERYERYLRDPAWQVIASAAADETALDIVAGRVLGRRSADDDNSPFAAAVCKGLRGAADLRIDGQPGDGVILANELHVYLESAFERLEHQLGRRVQKPLLWSLAGKDKGQFIFFTPGRPLALRSALELVEKNNPYQGLEPFGEDKAYLFFGRDEAVRQLLEQVKTQPLTVVSGISGSGKSSVVRAGLVSRLRKDPDWLLLPLVRPGPRPLAALCSIHSELAASEQTELADAVSAWCSGNPGKQLLLVIDQLEELVTMGATPAEQQKFLGDVLRALSESRGCLHVVMTLRSDFEPHFVELLTPKPGTQVRFLVRPLTRQELRQVIEGPASERVLYFEPATLVDQLIEEVAEMPGALPLLSFTMSELYRTYVRNGRTDRCLAALDYQRFNGVAGALSQRADEIFQSLDAAHQGTLQRVMLRMVSIQAGEVARRRVPLDELRYGDSHPEEARKQAVLNLLKEARLVVSGKDNEGTPYVEPAHDKLVLGWPQLWTYIKQQQETIPLQRLLTQEAATWAQGGHKAGHLWAGNPRLPLVVDLRKKVPEYFNALESAFIEKSERRRRRQRNLLIAIPCLIIAGLSGLTWFAFYERNKADEQRKEAQEQKALAEQQTKRADEQATTAKSRLLESYVDRGRQLLFESGQPSEGLLWLHRAQADGCKDEALPDLLNSALHAAGTPKAVFIGHEDSVSSAMYSPDGRRIVTASRDKTARVWDADSGRLVAVLKGHGASVYRATYSPDGRRIVTASGDRTARVWDADSGRLVAVLKGHGAIVRSATYSPDGRRIVTASDDHAARVWEADSGRLVAVFKGHGSGVVSATYSPNGRRIVTASGDHTARVWDADSGRLVAVLKGHGSDVVSATYSPDGRRIVTASADLTARVWEADSGRLVAVLRGHEISVESATYSPDGRRIVTASADLTARVWEADSGRLVAVLKGHGRGVESATYSPDGRRIVTASWDRTARVWEADSGRLVAELKGHGHDVTSARYSPDGRRIVTASEDKTARVWEADSGRLVAELKGHGSGVVSATYGPDGRRIVTTSDDHTARVWEADSGRLVAELKGHRSGVRSATYSPDGRRIVTASADHTARVWEVDSGRLVVELKGHRASVWSATYSPDGRRIVTVSADHTARVWEVDSGRLIAELKGHEAEVLSAAYSPDGRRIVTASADHTARVWEVDSGRLVAELKGHWSGVWSATYSPDGRRIVTASADLTARVWEADSGRLVVELKEHGASVWSATYSPDGRRIVTASWDGTARVWVADSGRLVAELKGHGARVWSARYSPDGRRIVTTSDDKAARVWEADSCRLIAVLKGHGDTVRSATYSPDGRRIVTASADHTARVWDLSANTRTHEQLASFMRCHIPVQFDPSNKNVLVPNDPTPPNCVGAVPPP